MKEKSPRNIDEAAVYARKYLSARGRQLYEEPRNDRDGRNNTAANRNIITRENSEDINNWRDKKS